MQIKTEIKVGQTKRVVVSIKGKKHYAYIQCTHVESFKKCHAADLKNTGTSGDK